MPKKHIAGEHQDQEQVHWATKTEVAQVDVVWEHKGEVFVA